MSQKFWECKIISIPDYLCHFLQTAYLHLSEPEGCIKPASLTTLHPLNLAKSQVDEKWTHLWKNIGYSFLIEFENADYHGLHRFSESVMCTSKLASEYCQLSNIKYFYRRLKTLVRYCFIVSLEGLRVNALGSGCSGCSGSLIGEEMRKESEI